MSSSSAQPLSNPYGATLAPPPTPAAQSNHVSSEAADALSRLFHHLPPSLSLPSRLSPRTVSPPVISFSPQDPTFLNTHLSSFSKLGFFQLTNNLVSSELAKTAESEALSLFNLSKAQKQEFFSKTWPLGYEDGDDNNNTNERSIESFCFDSSCSSEFSDSTHSLQELTSKLGKIGLQTVEALSCAMGFEKQLKEQDSPFSSLMWISEGSADHKQSGRFYPYIISLQYQIRCRKYSVLADSGWVTVSPQIDSVLVTVGDIAQVWSNGRLKKVRGRPVAIPGNKDDDSRCITMSLLVTLPTDTTVTVAPFRSNHHENTDDNEEGDKKVFDAFSFEDYAWRVYHERFLFKDPLDRYRTK
ncbi:hypothetical protein ACHQM5_013637 [Ranunculus cassubicifolius]